MVIRDAYINDVEDFVLDLFDSFIYGAVDDSTDAESAEATALTGELLRRALSAMTKDVTNNKYHFWFRVPLSSLTGETIRRFGIFDQVIGGNLAAIAQLPVAYTIPSTNEVRFALSMTIVGTNA